MECIRRPCLAVVAAIAAGALASAQSPAGGQPQQPTFRGGTNVVRVDLYALREGGTVDDLKAAEVDVFEDGVKQTIDSFERVVVRPPVSQELRAEPNSVAESRQMAADPRARIFVIFLDTYHTGFGNAARLQGALQQFIDRVVGQDDLVGLMTPEMSARDVTLGRRTTVISRLLDVNNWGRRGRLVDNDPDEDTYEACYAFDPPDIVRAMKARRREKLSLDALDDLVVYLGGLRDERKAVFAVSEGWLEYGPDPNLARPLESNNSGPIIARPPIVDRGTRDQRSAVTDRAKCEADRATLATMDNSDRLLRMAETANRVNVTFYPVGAQGLAVFDSDIGPEPPPGLREDAANLRNRQNGLRLLADMTDGVSIVNTNNVTPLLKRVVDDMSSYYLLTYASTNSKLDGRFRSINVRLSRPGVQTRFRRGYRALTAKDVPTTISGAAAAPVVPPAQGAVLTALNAMAFNPRAELRLRASAYALPAAAGQGAFWLVGTLDDATRRGPEWGKSATADVAVRGSDGRTVLTAAVPLGADGGFAVQVPETGGLIPGDYAIRVRAKGAAGATIDETARVTIGGEPPPIGDAVVWRRRPATGLTYFRNADPRASRTDRLRLEFATAATAAPAATLLDRAGQAMAVPLQVSARDEAGVRWIVVDLTLAPLAPGDYAVEVKAGDATRTTAFRVVP
ncbi:MAG TPA: VWA domain-containing protein [Vicinamibacterales bacterium]|nr:VWA domain-containing protein [Vicinamibacterales bacterium]